MVTSGSSQTSTAIDNSNTNNNSSESQGVSPVVTKGLSHRRHLRGTAIKAEFVVPKRHIKVSPWSQTHSWDPGRICINFQNSLIFFKFLKFKKPQKHQWCRWFCWVAWPDSKIGVNHWFIHMLKPPLLSLSLPTGLADGSVKCEACGSYHTCLIHTWSLRHTQEWRALKWLSFSTSVWLEGVRNVAISRPLEWAWA